MHLRRAAAALAVSFWASSAWAADDQGRYTVIGGPAQVTCQEWLDLQGSGNVREEQVNAWVAGFVSAYNRYGHPGRNVLAGRDPVQLLHWTDRFCRVNHGATMTVAAEMMIESLLTAKDAK